MTIQSLLITVLRIFLGAILLFAGIAKLTSFSVFIADVAAYQILPLGLVKPSSYLIVSSEITLGMALFIGYFSRGAGVLSALVFLIFSVALVIVLLREQPIVDCGCGNILFSLLDKMGFSVAKTPNWNIVIIDIVLVLASVGVVYSSQQGYGLDTLIKHVVTN
ncbi:DoxX family membrane protein [Candidatus Poribacteria bacterium]|nr:DoxX family membrane protein [Candidatus Poribacteria bacterium]